MNAHRKQLDTVAQAELSAATAVVFYQPSVTQQSHREDADINVLVARLKVDPLQVPPEVYDPRYYGDTADLPDLGTALVRISEARSRFDALPARLRKRFDNSPAKLWEFVNDPENRAEAITLGLLRERPSTGLVGGQAPSPASPPPPGGRPPEGAVAPVSDGTQNTVGTPIS